MKFFSITLALVRSAFTSFPIASPVAASASLATFADRLCDNYFEKGLPKSVCELVNAAKEGEVEEIVEKSINTFNEVVEPVLKFVEIYYEGTDDEKIVVFADGIRSAIITCSGDVLKELAGLKSEKTAVNILFQMLKPAQTQSKNLLNALVKYFDWTDDNKFVKYAKIFFNTDFSVLSSIGLISDGLLSGVPEPTDALKMASAAILGTEVSEKAEDAVNDVASTVSAVNDVASTLSGVFR